MPESREREVSVAAAWQRLQLTAHSSCAKASRPLAMIQHSTIFRAHSKSRSARITSSSCSRSPEQKVLTQVAFAIASSANCRTGISEWIRNLLRAARALLSTLRLYPVLSPHRVSFLGLRLSAPTNCEREYRQEPFGDVGTGLMFDNPWKVATAQARQHDDCRRLLSCVD
jgi:hypothetical protein